MQTYNTHPHTLHGTTVIGVRHQGKIALGSDGQATMGNTVMKQRARKVRALANGAILAGFAGATADALNRNSSNSMGK